MKSTNIYLIFIFFIMLTTKIVVGADILPQKNEVDNVPKTSIETKKTELPQVPPSKDVPFQSKTDPEVNLNDNQKPVKKEKAIADSEDTDKYNWQKISAIVTAFATVALAILTAFYVRFTHRMLKEMQKARDPAIDIDFEIASTMLKEVFLWIKNAGDSPARNISFHIEEDLPLAGLYELQDVHLKDANIFRNGISYLAPDRKRKEAVGRLKYNPQIWGPEKYIVNIVVSFENFREEKLKTETTIDILQCLDPVVIRGDECASPSARSEIRMPEGDD